VVENESSDYILALLGKDVVRSFCQSRCLLASIRRGKKLTQ